MARRAEPGLAGVVKAMAVIPARDAQATIGDVVQGLKGALPMLSVLVVDDGSVDATSARAREAGADVIRHEVNGGKGAALQTGFDEALRRRADAGLTLGADGQHDPSYATNMLQGHDRVHVVIRSADRDRKGAPLRAS